MWRYAVRRILLAVPTFLGITLVTFLVIEMAPGDPALAKMGPASSAGLSRDTYERLRESYGLDQPVWRRYLIWLRQVALLDFGRSYHDGRAVTAKIAERLSATLSLAGGAMVLALLLAIGIGLYSAAKRDGPFDTIAGVILYGLYSVPRYVLGMILIILVGVKLEWLPFQGMVSDHFDTLSAPGKLADVARHFVLIGVCFAYPLVAYQSRFVRANVLEVMGRDFIRTARAKGLRERTVVVRHAFRNTLIPLITMLGMLVPSVLGGSVILETMFAWPGLGQLFFVALTQRDYPTVMALSVVTACLVLLATLLADLAYALVDPRVRYD
jgi:peptide/nickel transport system permease protein